MNLSQQNLMPVKNPGNIRDEGPARTPAAVLKYYAVSQEVLQSKTDLSQQKNSQKVLLLTENIF